MTHSFSKSLPLVLVGLLAACSGPPRTDIGRTAEPAPIALLVMQEIAGETLGKPIVEPFGLAVDNTGNVFVSDAGNHRVIKFDSSLQATADIGGYGAGEGFLDDPSFVVLDNDLNLIVSDPGNKRLCWFDRKLNFVDEFRLYDEEDPLKYGTPSGLALTRYGELWMGDREMNRIVAFDNIGRFDRFVGDFGYSGGQLGQPEKILRLSDNDLFVVCDAANGRLMVYDGFGNFEWRVEYDGFEYPISVASEPDGDLWVIDGATGQLFFLSRGRTVRFETGPQIPGTGRTLRNPSDIAILPDGNLLIADTGNNRLLVCQIIMED